MIVDELELRKRDGRKKWILTLLLLATVVPATKFVQEYKFKVLEPEQGSTVGPDISKLRGSAEPFARIRVYDSERELTTVDADKEGKWFLEMPFQPGTHHIRLVALNEKGERAAEYGPFGFTVAWRENDPPRILVPGEDDVLAAGVPIEMRGKGEPLKPLEIFANDHRLGVTSPNRDGRWSFKTTFSGVGAKSLVIRSKEKPELRHQVQISVN